MQKQCTQSTALPLQQELSRRLEPLAKRTGFIAQLIEKKTKKTKQVLSLCLSGAFRYVLTQCSHMKKQLLVPINLGGVHYSMV